MVKTIKLTTAKNKRNNEIIDFEKSNINVDKKQNNDC